MKIIVTGGAGFIGSHTCNLLEKSGHEVLVVDNFSTGKSENLQGFRGKVALADITDLELLEKAFSDFRPESILHLAAQSAITTSWDDPAKDLSANGIGTLNLLKISKKYGVRRFVFSSTSAVYRESGSGRMNEAWQCEPSTPYGISKLAAEQYVRAFFPNHLVLRYGNVYGERQKSIGENQVVARAFAHFINGNEFRINGNGRQKRDFVHVSDIAYANCYALTDNVVGTFNAATGKSFSVNEVLSILEKIYDVPGYKWEHTKTNDPRGDVNIGVGSIRREIGWVAVVKLEEGLKRTADWWNGMEKK